MLQSAQTIAIVPIGTVDSDIIESIAFHVRQVFGFQTKISFLLENVEFAFEASREQYHSTAILEELSARSNSDALKVVAITNVDLFIPILTFVYGEAQLNGKACVVSTCRLADNLSVVTNREAYIFRVVKEAIHELGHTFSLRHCQDQLCIMHYCRSIKDVDRKSNDLCRYCRIMMEDEIRHLRDLPANR